MYKKILIIWIHVKFQISLLKNKDKILISMIVYYNFHYSNFFSVFQFILSEILSKIRYKLLFCVWILKIQQIAENHILFPPRGSFVIVTILSFVKLV